MKFDTRTPCGSCPYRIDAPLGLWDEQHFRDLERNDADEIFGAIYGCHATRKRGEPSVCAGWLLDQIRRGIPSIQMRLALARDRRLDLEELSDGGHVLYDSIADMVAANDRVYALQRKRALKERR